MSQGIVLCGFMGAGKSKLGCLLAGMLSYRFEDLDDEIQKYEEKNITELFAEVGQSGFRVLERACLLKKVRDEKRILSLGGGALHDQHTTDLVLAHNLLIFIKPEFDTILSRIAGNPKRPLVMRPDGTPKTLEELKSDLQPLFQKREPYYSQAHIHFSPDPDWSALTSATKLFEIIKQHGQHQ